MLSQQIDAQLAERKKWALRRQLGIPPNRGLFILACMDERISINEILGIHDGDAHIFRNAGGFVTDDAIRSAMLSTQFCGTKEIIIINHTGCAMLSSSGDSLVNSLKNKGVDVQGVSINPALPELTLQDQSKNFAKWMHLVSDIDAACQEQIELLKSSPLIPQDVVINGYIWEVESMSLRRPYDSLGKAAATAQQMAPKK